MKQRLTFLLLVILFFLGYSSAFASQARIALVIGNANYSQFPLENPVNDAKEMSQTLERLGFEVMGKTNLNYAEMNLAVEEFSQRISLADNPVALFYFAGHGVSIKGVNYLLPVGQPFLGLDDLTSRSLPATSVMKHLGANNTQSSFVILDACRNNPFAESKGESMYQDGLSRMFPPSGTLIAYASEPGTTANDGGDMGHGLYTYHLMKNMGVPGITAEQVFKRTRLGVEVDSDYLQSPREESSLVGADFYFNPIEMATKTSPDLLEIMNWQSIKHSADIHDFNDYVSNFPNGAHVAQAKRKINELKKLIKSDPSLIKARIANNKLRKGLNQEAVKIYELLANGSDPISQARGLEGLAEIALDQSKLNDALTYADKALALRPSSTMANYIKAQLAFRNGNMEKAEHYLNLATQPSASSDLAYQRGLVRVALGNVKVSSDKEAAKVAFQSAIESDPKNTIAIANLVTLLSKSGDNEKALKVLDTHSVGVADEASIVALRTQIQKRMQSLADKEKQSQINKTIKELVSRYQDNQQEGQTKDDKWTSAPLLISVLGFEQKSKQLNSQLGLNDLLADELSRELSAKHISVVERNMLSELLDELNLGSSKLVDQSTQIKLGKMFAARVIVTGSLYYLNGVSYVSLRAIDVETTKIISTKTLKVLDNEDILDAAATMANEVASIVTKAYPIRGRVAYVENDMALVNIGKNNNVYPGDLYKVLGKPEEIVFQGKVIGHKENSQLAVIRISRVEDDIAYGVLVEKNDEVKENLRIEKMTALN